MPRERRSSFEAAAVWEAAEALFAAQRPLLGAWVSVKDLFQLEGAPMKAGTEATLPPMPAASSTVVQRLQAAGALVFAKTNMHEIALGATGENPWTGDVCNPHDPARQSGGSSSGSGVAVAVGLGSASIGSDTGGSIRIPSAFCGVVGFKPTVGSVSLAGALPLSWTCDHAGPLARSVEDAALLVEYLDATTATLSEYIAGLSEADLDDVIDTSWTPHVTRGVRLVSMIDDAAQHVGQAAYAAGILAGGA